MEFNEILSNAPYSMAYDEKQTMLLERLNTLHGIHYEHCVEYRNLINSLYGGWKEFESVGEFPFLPVALFKELELKDIDEKDIFKIMTSSGTTGQRVSKIFLNRETANNQQKALTKIVADFTGSARMPMLILDCPSVVRDRRMFSARGAGILGFSIFGTKKVYALNDDMQLNVEELQRFLEINRGKRIFLFGFTFMVWQHFYRELLRLKSLGIEFDLSEGILIHGGGWKKLESESVSPKVFHNSLRSVCGLRHIYDYYGMVEQTGCIYMQCEYGHLHASIFSDVIVRNPIDFSECEFGEKGVIQVVSTIPESYPGYSLLTEDVGVILGEDDCPCGRKGKYFKVIGRLQNAEIRGCSDTYAAKF